MRAHLIADFQHVTHAGGHRHRDLGAVAGQERVGADREAMYENVDVTGRDSSFVRDAANT